jgi:GGDEF domain-containing protein
MHITSQNSVFRSVSDRSGLHAGDTVLEGTASLLLRDVRHNASAARAAKVICYRVDGHRHAVFATSAAPSHQAAMAAGRSPTAPARVNFTQPQN